MAVTRTAGTRSSNGSKASTTKEVQGYPSPTLEIFTVEVEHEFEGWVCYDSGGKAGPQFFVSDGPARELARAILGEDPERGVRIVRWYRLVTTERI
jgi:hypothetical protein